MIDGPREGSFLPSREVQFTNPPALPDHSAQFFDMVQIDETSSLGGVISVEGVRSVLSPFRVGGLENW